MDEPYRTPRRGCVFLVAPSSPARDRLTTALIRRSIDVTVESDPTLAVARVLSVAPDVLIVDTDTPTAARDIVLFGERAPTATLLAWIADDDPRVVHYVASGAFGVVSKNAPSEDAVEAIAVALDGEPRLPLHLRSGILEEVVRLDAEHRRRRAHLHRVLTGLGLSAPDEDAYHSAVEALASAVELRDEYTGGHIARVSTYSLAIAARIDPELTEPRYVYGYLLHDIGKLAISDAILLKPGPLTTAEYELLKTHTTEGARYVSAIPFLRDAHPVVRNHHERWDGSGYPDRLAGEDIPLIARIFAVADAFDAITTDRPYRSARPFEAAVREITTCAGSQFDPDVVDVFRDAVVTDDAFEQLRRGVVPGHDTSMRPAIGQALDAYPPDVSIQSRN